MSAVNFSLARLAYTTPTGPAIDAVHEIDVSAKKAFFYSCSGAEYFTIVYEDKLVFSFRGSSSPSDFIADASFYMTPLHLNATQAPSLVHNGFYAQWNSIQFEVMASIITFCRSREDPPQIVCVGHSLGGALATLCAAAAKSVLGARIRMHCETYGSPRVGNSLFAAAFDETVDTSLRVVNGNDAVTLMPHMWYVHVKGLFEIGKKSSSIWCSWFGKVEDHYLNSYALALPLLRT